MLKQNGSTLIVTHPQWLTVATERLSVTESTCYMLHTASVLQFHNET